MPITILGLKSDLREDKETIGTFINYDILVNGSILDQLLDMANVLDEFSLTVSL